MHGITTDIVRFKILIYFEGQLIYITACNEKKKLYIIFIRKKEKIRTTEMTLLRIFIFVNI